MRTGLTRTKSREKDAEATEAQQLTLWSCINAIRQRLATSAIIILPSMVALHETKDRDQGRTRRADWWAVGI